MNALEKFLRDTQLTKIAICVIYRYFMFNNS